MRTLALVAVLLVSAAGWAGIALDQTVIKNFTNCSSSGSSAQTLAAGEYLLTVINEDTNLCLADSASTCSSGGTLLLVRTEMLYTVPAGTLSVSCRSTGSTGTLQFTRRGN